MTEADEHEQRLLALEREIIAMREDMEAAIARAEKAEAELQRLSFVSGNVALDHPDWPPEYARHLAALVVRAEAAEKRVKELEEALSSAREMLRGLGQYGPIQRGARAPHHAFGPSVMARVTGGSSLFPEERPELCKPDKERCGHWRTVQCDGTTDVVECSKCGAQRTAACNFDDDYA